MSWGIPNRLKQILGFSEDMNDERESVGSVWKIPKENPYVSEPPKAESTSNPKLFSSTLNDEQAAQNAAEYWKKQDAGRQAGGESAIPRVDQGVPAERQQAKQDFAKRWSRE